MSDFFYSLVRTVCHPVFILSRKPTLAGVEKLRRKGAFLIAANHTSPYDIAVLMAHSPARRLDFVSATEICNHPLFGPFHKAMNAFPIDRAKPDGGAVRELLNRLERGRAVVIFPEGGFRLGAQSMLNGGKIRPGLGRIALLAQVPVLPVVLFNTAAYTKPKSWIWGNGTRYGVVVGEPMVAPQVPQDAPAAQLKEMAAAFETEYLFRMKALFAEIKAAMPDLSGPGVEP